MRKELKQVIESIQAAAERGEHLTWGDVEDTVFEALGMGLVPAARRDALWDAAYDAAGRDPEYADVISELDAVLDAR